MRSLSYYSAVPPRVAGIMQEFPCLFFQESSRLRMIGQTISHYRILEHRPGTPGGD
jgi:hypothetical protein